MSMYNASREESKTRHHAYAFVNGINMLTQYGMELLSYDTGSPEPLVRIIDVPGRPGGLDATLALTGKVNYKSRAVKVEFYIPDITHEDYTTLKANLLKLYDGMELKIKLSTDPDYYYKGRFTLSFVKSNPVSAHVIFECANAFPYKLEEITVQDTISGSKNVACTGKDYNSAVTINASAAMSVTYGSKTYQLSSGNNAVPEIHFSSGNNTMRFVGTGSVTIKYERGIL